MGAGPLDATPAPVSTIVLDLSQVIDNVTSAFENMSLLDQILFAVDGVDLVGERFEGAACTDRAGFAVGFSKPDDQGVKFIEKG